MAQEEFREVPLGCLQLDPQNPRLPRDADWSSEPEVGLLRQFLRSYNLIELARSIVDKGFTPRHAEALLVVEDSSNADQYVVVEGNRRLATLKLLTCAESRREVGARGSEWEDLARDASRLDLKRVPIIVYPNRAALDDYLGFRHITGPTPWRPEAKARFIAKLLGGGDSVGDVARHIGSNHRTVRRYAEAYAIYSQAAEADIEMDTVEAAFGVFYNALDIEGIRGFLGLGRQMDINTLPEAPVPSDSMEQLRELIGLLYGDSSRDLVRVIGESRDLRKLGRVLANSRARANLLRDRNLERAWHVSGGGRDDMLGQLSDLYSRLAEVSGKSMEYAEDDEVRSEVRRIRDLVLDMVKRYRIPPS